MSTEQSVDPELVEQTKQQIRNLVREIAQIAKSDISPPEFYDAVLNRIVTALAAVGGAVWTVSETGQLMLEYQINLVETRLAENEEDQVRHGRLLRKVMAAGDGMLVAPQSGFGSAEEGGNPTEFLLVLGPLKTAHETAGVLEIFQRPGSSPTVQQGYKRFLMQMCELASEYLKSRKLQHFTDRQALWAQLENFTRLVHQGLDARSTAYTIANEGRRLVGCDRVSVGIVRGRKCVIEAVSGQDMFDKRSNTIATLTHLASAVASSGEPVWYTGDTSMMAPQVEEAVQEYVDEVHSKAVAVVPLKQPHDKTDPTARPKVLAVLIIEQIEDSRPREGLSQRIDVVSEHSAIALANVLEHNELFLMPVWRAVGKSKWIVEARQLPYTITIGSALLLLTLFLCLWPADFKLTGKGKLQPVNSRNIFASLDGEIIDVKVAHGEPVKKGQVLARMRNTDLDVKLESTRGNLDTAQASLYSAKNALDATSVKKEDEIRLKSEVQKYTKQISSLSEQMEMLQKEKERLTITSPVDGQLVTWDVQRLLLGRTVQRSQILMRVVDPEGPWEVEVMMPEHRMGFIKDAQAKYGKDLRVEFITATEPGLTHEGTIRDVDRTAEVRGDEGNTVLIQVAFDKQQVPDLRDGASVTAKVHCGRAAVGYVWLHDLVSFVQSKVLFYLF